MRKITLLTALLLSFVGVKSAWAETLTADFNSGFPEGWTIVGDLSRNSDRARSGSGVWTYSKSDNANYLVTEAVEGTLTFYARAYNKNTNAYVFVYAYDGTALGEQLFATPNMKTSSTPSWSSYSVNLGTYRGQVAIALNYAAIDDVTYTQMEAVDGPALDVAGHNEGVLDFGMVDPGTIRTLTLLNPGTEAITVNITTEGGFTANPTSATIAADGTQTLEISAPDATATGKVTITPTVTTVEPVEIALSCVVKDPSKMFVDFSDNALPEDWTEYTASTSYSAWSYEKGYAENTGSTYYEKYLMTPAMIFESDELLMFDAMGNNAWEPNYGSNYEGSVTVQTSTDGQTFVDLQTFAGLHYNQWKSCSVLIPAGTMYVRFKVNKFASIDNIYGGKIDETPRPKLAVEGYENGSTLSWGYADVPAGNEKTITLQNTGKAALDVTFIVTDDYTLSATGATIAAGETFDLTIGTPAHDGNGVLTIQPADGSGLAAFTINLTSYYKVPKAEMALDKKNVNFGKVYADATETITVTNNGDATLTATIANDNEERFDVSVAEVTVEPGESATFDITYTYDGTISGLFTANITLTPNDGSAQTIVVTANNKKVGVWSEDFEEGIPGSWTNDGWTVSRKWNEDNSVNHAYAAMGSGYLITPRLKATAGEELTFDFVSNYATLVVEYANDIEATEWTSVGTYQEDQTITFTAPADGIYYLRFSGSGSYLDNFEGFQFDQLAADILIVASTLPANVYQYAPYQAQVKVQNKGTDAQVTVAKLFVDGAEVASTEADLAVEGEVTLNLSYTPAEAAENVPVKIEVTLKDVAEFAAKTIEGTLTITAVPVLSETEAPTLAESYEAVKLEYTPKSGWNTIALPFVPTSAQMTQIFGEGWKAYYFSKYENGALSFQATTNIRAGVPFVVYVAEAREGDAPVLTNVSVTAAEAGSDDSNGAAFMATYAPLAAGEMTGKYGLTNAGKIAKGTANASMRGFRGYFDLPAGAEVKALVFDENDESTVITGVAVEEMLNGADLFDMSGRRVNVANAKGGVYILNGKKVYVK